MQQEPLPLGLFLPSLRPPNCVRGRCCLHWLLKTSPPQIGRDPCLWCNGCYATMCVACCRHLHQEKKHKEHEIIWIEYFPPDQKMTASNHKLISIHKDVDNFLKCHENGDYDWKQPK